MNNFINANIYQTLIYKLFLVIFIYIKLIIFILQSEHIRTIIKARGISYPNVTGKTFAVFRVDKRHHLVSLVSMIFPSPDWIVGVSGLELCARNGSWIESRVLNLYPWDAGTDSGPTYIVSIIIWLALCNGSVHKLYAAFKLYYNEYVIKYKVFKVITIINHI